MLLWCLLKYNSSDWTRKLLAMPSLQIIDFYHHRILAIIDVNHLAGWKPPISLPQVKSVIHIKCLTTLLMYMRFKTVKVVDDCSASIDCSKSEFEIIFQFWQKIWMVLCFLGFHRLFGTIKYQTWWWHRYSTVSKINMTQL